jgi:hypothetical protein
MDSLHIPSIAPQKPPRPKRPPQRQCQQDLDKEECQSERLAFAVDALQKILDRDPDAEVIKVPRKVAQEIADTAGFIDGRRLRDKTDVAALWAYFSPLEAFEE